MKDFGTGEKKLFRKAGNMERERIKIKSKTKNILLSLNSCKDQAHLLKQK